MARPRTYVERVPYRRHREMYKAAVKRRRAAQRALIQAAKTRPCMDCGVTYPPYVMDLDHRGDKVLAVSQMVNVARARLIAEIAKCDVVCSNCHRERTEKQQGRKPSE